MRGRLSLVLMIAAALGLAPPAGARARGTGAVVVLQAGRLADALRELSIRSGVDLLFTPEVVAGLRSPRVVGSRDVDQFLLRLLDGSGLDFRRTAAGTIVVFRPVTRPPPTVPELLVVGRRAQNADIPRTRNDIQGYRVATSANLLASHTGEIDQFLRTRLPSDAQPVSAAQGAASALASTRSIVNLHGLGASQTLVLVDGVRLPGLPSAATLSSALDQPDLNGVPLEAVERIESLTASAGGVYGPGATGGVVNIVLKRDYRGGDVSVTYGGSDRGDAAQHRVFGRLGFTPDDGRTDVMIAFSQSRRRGLLESDRDYRRRAQAAAAAASPSGDAPLFPPISSGVTIHALAGGDLSLKPALGGASLGSPFTFLPAGFGGVLGDDGARLLANAGRTPDPLAAGLDDRSLTSDAAGGSVLLNVRHHFSEDVEAFFDLIGLENDGRAITRTGGFQAPVLSTAPTNPFQQDIALAFPVAGLEADVRNRLRTTRVSAGLIVRLQRGWSAEANYNLGRTRNLVAVTGVSLRPEVGRLIAFGVPGPNGEPVPDPFGDASAFAAALDRYKVAQSLRTERRDDLQDGHLRLAGPVFETKAGAASLSLLVERRHEEVPTTQYTQTIGDLSGTNPYPGFSQTVTSLYGELRAPLASRAGGSVPWRGLELQLAARRDLSATRFPAFENGLLSNPAGAARRAATVYTAGFRTFPRDDLMLRASVATGSLPPTPAELIESTLRSIVQIPDPRRPGRLAGGEAPFTILTGGSLDTKPVRARTVSIGLVLNPDAEHGPRVSLDYRHIDLRDLLVAPPSGTFILAHEELFPDRVRRAPLTPQDQADGLTGGVLTQIDTTSRNVLRVVTDAVDVQADYRIHQAGGATWRLYGSATWQPRLKRHAALGNPAVEFVGAFDGPLRWRGAGGVSWSRGPLTLNAGAQYYGRYSSAAAGRPDRPGVAVPAQAYFDLSASYWIALDGAAGPARNLEIGLGLSNVFDRSPPIVADATHPFGYSYYGDPRRRRFEVSATARF